MERYEKTNHQKRECPKVCPGEDVEDGQLKTGEQLRFACLHTRLRAWLDHEVREYCILLFFYYYVFSTGTNILYKVCTCTENVVTFVHFIVVV